jgi:hypothetical protein
VGPYVVIDAADHAKARANVGNRIEVIGQVFEIKKAKTKYGTGYAFVNFGPWKGNIVKLAIWSKALKKFTSEPDDTWVGKYISVTGLVDQPYTNRHYHYTHISINVAEPSEIQFITQVEAEYRLGRRSKPIPSVAAAGKLSNKAVLDAVKKGVALPPLTGSYPTQLSTNNPTQSNQGIAASLRHASAQTRVQGGIPSQTQSPSTVKPARQKFSLLAAVPAWAWGILLLVLLRVCSSL